MSDAIIYDFSAKDIKGNKYAGGLSGQGIIDRQYRLQVWFYAAVRGSSEPAEELGDKGFEVLGFL